MTIEAYLEAIKERLVTDSNGHPLRRDTRALNVNRRIPSCAARAGR